MVKKLRSLATTIQQFNNQVKVLRANLQQLQDAMNGINHFVTGVNRVFDKWQFKSRPRIERIQKISQRLTKLNR